MPEFSDPINTVVTLNYYWDEVAFKDEVEKHIRKYANKSRRTLGAEILGEGSSSGNTTTTTGNSSSGEATASRWDDGTNYQESFGTG